MDLIVHDFSGHPFQADLARRLASRGHRVRHLSAEEYISGKGHLKLRPDDPDGLTFEPVVVGRAFEKYSFRRRLSWELDYGTASAKALADRPDAVIMCNVSIFSLARFAPRARRMGIPWMLWHQDIYSVAMAEEASRRLPTSLARAMAWSVDKVEAYGARRADQVVAIGEAFRGAYERWQVAADRVSVIPNWAPLDEIVLSERQNPEADVLFPGDGTALRLLYAGTLGRKHNPMLLVDVLRKARAAGIDAQLTVVSEGEAADDLQAVSQREPGLPLRVVGFRPAESLSDALQSADVLVGLLEPEASAFSIPSKMLTYMAAGRPILGLLPADNPVAVDTITCGGFIGPPTDQGVDEAVRWLGEIATQPAERAEIGRRMRKLAEEHFDPHRITDQFEAVLRRMIDGRRLDQAPRA